MTLRSLSFITIALFVGGTWLYAAQDAAMIEERQQSLYDELRCPTCQGLSIKDSEANFSRQIRNKVDQLVEEGRSDEEIRGFFVERYGEWILRSPPKQGFNLVLWGLPFVAIILGMLFVLRRSQAWKQKFVSEAVSETESPEFSSEIEQRIAKDLKAFEDS